VETSGQGFALEVARELRSRLAEGAPLDRAKEIGMLEDAIEALEDAQGGGRRIADIVRDLSALGRPNSARVRVRLAEVVASALEWIQPSLREGATVDVDDPGAPPVMASASQLSQVVVNLLSNAVKATPPGERGRIVVRLGAGDAVSWIEVQDHGVGIAPDIIDRVFDPFFTTRPTGEGRGTGLGLAICHAIVTDHGGTLTVASEVGMGSTFRMELPVAPVEA
jgi:signal transduction histidine kinase